LGARSGEADALPVWVAIARLTLWQPFSEAGRNRCIEAGERGLEIAERVGDDVARGHLLRDTATARHDLASDPPRSLNDMQKAGELFQANGKTLYSALAISTYGTFVALTDPERGRRLQTTQTEVARSTGWLLTAARMERGLAQTEFDCGLVEKAIESTKRTVDVFRDYKLPLDLGISLIYLSSYLALAEQYDEAVAAGREALAMARDYHWEGFAAWSCQALALAYAGNERTTLAARLLGFVDASYEARGVKRRRADAAVYLRLTTLLRERFEDGEFEEAVAIGRTLTVDAACAVAIGEPAPHSAKDGKQVLTNEKVPYGS
jgi:tetratricopeptide (TPR) repeat protein